MFVTLGKWEGWVKRVLQKHINIESYFSIDSGASRLGSGWGPFPHFHTAIFYLHLHMVLSRKNKLSPVSSYKGTNSIMIALSTKPNHLPKAPSLNSITLGTMVSNLNGGGDVNGQSMTADSHLLFSPLGNHSLIWWLELQRQKSWESWMSVFQRVFRRSTDLVNWTSQDVVRPSMKLSIPINQNKGLKD